MTSKPGTSLHQQVMQVLTNAGYKLTKPRIQVVSCLLDGQHAHTAEEIGRHLSALANKTTVNMRTVYGVLNLLKSLNLVHEHFISGKHRFELTTGHDDHIHLLDEDGNLRTMKVGKELHEALAKTAADSGYRMKDVQISMHVVKRGDG